LGGRCGGSYFEKAGGGTIKKRKTKHPLGQNAHGEMGAGRGGDGELGGGERGVKGMRRRDGRRKRTCHQPLKNKQVAFVNGL